MEHLKSIFEWVSVEDKRLILENIRRELSLNNDWIEIEDPDSIFPNAEFCYEYPIEDGYKIMVLSRSNGSDLGFNCILYLIDNESSQFLDDLLDPFVFKGLFKDYVRNKYSNFCIDVAKKQMDYYHKLKKMPTEDDLKIEILTDFIDDGYNWDRININFGYFSEDSIKKNTNHDLTVYHSDHKFPDFGCIITFGIWDPLVGEKLENFKDNIYYLEGRLNFFGKFKVSWYENDGYGLLIIIKLL